MDFSSPSYRDTVLRAGTAAVAAVSMAMFVSGTNGLPLDDSYIHLVFAKNLAAGHGFSFNPGEFSLGFTSPLWVGMLALTGLIGAEPVSTARLFSALFLCVSAVLVFDLVRLSVKSSYGEDSNHTGRWPSVYGLFAGLGMAVSGNMLWLGGAGMEATLFLALGLASILSLSGDRVRPWLSGPLLGLFLLARPTGLVLWAILGAWLVLRKKDRKEVALFLLVSIVSLAGWSIFSYATTGHLLPPTRAGKLASNLFNAGFSLKGMRGFLLLHLRYLASADSGILYLALFGLVAAFLRKLSMRREGPLKDRLAGALPRITPASVLVLWALFHLLAHSIFFRSTYVLTPYHNLRYQVMLIPAVLAGASYALFMAASALGGGTGDSEDGLKRGIPLFMALILIIAPMVGEFRRAGEWQALYRTNIAHLAAVHKAAAVWSDEALPGDARIATLDIGIMGFFSGRYIIDMGGLVDPEAISYLEKKRAGKYMAKMDADYYFEMVRPPSDTITGVSKDEGMLYTLEEMRRFDFPEYANPVLLHSRGLVAHKVDLLAD